MTEYLHDISNEEFEIFATEKNADNINCADYLKQLAYEYDDRRFNFSILNLGMLLQITAISLQIKENEIESYLKLEKADTRKRKMEMIIKEINQKINLRYDFPVETEIVPKLYTYEGLGYIFVNKLEFLKLLNEKDIDIETLENM